MVHIPDDKPTGEPGLSGMADRTDPVEALERALCDEHVRAVVATVAGGLAHHFNNLLSGVLGLVSLAPTLDAAAMASLGDRLKTQIDHASRLIRVVLTLTRRAHQESDVGQCEAVGQARDVVGLAAVTASATVSVEADLPERDVLVPLSPVSVDRVLLVLLTAAIDRVVDDDGEVHLAMSANGDTCEFLVTATGASCVVPGTIAEATSDRSALSCMVARRLIEKAGGALELSDGDVRWRVTLPALRLS